MGLQQAGPSVMQRHQSFAQDPSLAVEQQLLAVDASAGASLGKLVAGMLHLAGADALPVLSCHQKQGRARGTHFTWLQQSKC